MSLYELITSNPHLSEGYLIRVMRNLKLKKQTFFFLFLIFFGTIGLGSSAVDSGFEDSPLGRATFSFSQVDGTYPVNSEFDLDLKILSKSSVASIRSYLTFDPNFFSVARVIADKNNFPYWWEQQITQGAIRLQASAPFPGFEGEGAIAKITMKALKPGTGVIGFDDSSLALTPKDDNILDLPSSSNSRVVVTEPTPRPSKFPVMLVGALGVIGTILLFAFGKKLFARR